MEIVSLLAHHPVSRPKPLSLPWEEKGPSLIQKTTVRGSTVKPGYNESIYPPSQVRYIEDSLYEKWVCISNIGMGSEIFEEIALCITNCMGKARKKLTNFVVGRDNEFCMGFQF